LGELFLNYVGPLLALAESLGELAFHLICPADLNMHAGDMVFYMATTDRLGCGLGVCL